MIGLSNMEYVVPENSKPPSQTADGLSSDMSRKTILECLLYFRMVLVIWRAVALEFAKAYCFGTTAGPKHTTNHLQQNHCMIKPQIQWVFCIIKIHRILNPQKTKKPLSWFPGISKNYQQKPTPPIAAAETAVTAGASWNR